MLLVLFTVLIHSAIQMSNLEQTIMDYIFVRFCIRNMLLQNKQHVVVFHTNTEHWLKKHYYALKEIWQYIPQLYSSQF